MARDALDPGADGDFPWWPRLPDGSTDPVRMPQGLGWQRTRDGRLVRVDLTPRDDEGRPIGPPATDDEGGE